MLSSNPGVEKQLNNCLKREEHIVLLTWGNVYFDFTVRSDIIYGPKVIMLIINRARIQFLNLIKPQSATNNFPRC